jgi:hypothetical protein
MTEICFFISYSLDHLINSWILDSTCYYHITPNKDWLDTYKLVNYSSILIGNNDPCKVVGIRNTKIIIFDDVVRISCEVKYISNLRKNLILLGTLNYNGFNLKSEGGVLKVSKGVMIVIKGHILLGNIYRLLGTIVVGRVAIVEFE